MHSSKTVEKKIVEDAEKPLTEYKCYYNPTSCKQSFPTKGLLDLHIDVYRGVRFLCSVPMCTKTFTSQARLRNHFEAKHKPVEPPPQQNCYIQLFPNMYCYFFLFVCELTADGSICTASVSTDNSILGTALAVKLLVKLQSSLYCAA